jgi:lipoprotein-anchoring transpeptidase ErfK/SrfK
MSPLLDTAQQALLYARQALQSGDRQAARHWAEKAAVLAPDLEEPWLILASLASPRASVAYLEQALKINPKSERANQEMRWALKRMRKATPEKRDRTPPRRVPPTVLAAAPPPGDQFPVKSMANYRWSFLAILALVVILTVAWVVLPGNAGPALALLHAAQDTPVFGAPAQVDKPTYTATFTQTYTPTETFTPTSTYTLTPTSTRTPLPTNTPRPTLPPPPTPTWRPWPTDVPYTYGDGGGEHWIDVDLSSQMVYAYEGGTVVASFLVSTGVAAYPTVTGQYHVYVKYEYTDMSGVGYYLPDVPYTMYFYRGYSLHGTYWHNNFGTPMSHGCVNMRTPDAKWLFYWSPLGILVNIHY